MLRTFFVGVFVFLFALASAPAEAGPILLNGSFEIGPPEFGAHDIDIVAGSTEITGWTVTGGGVDLLENPWDVLDGIRGIDLDLRSPGGIEQTFATAIGSSYLVSFWVSGNPEGGDPLKRLRAAAGGVSLDYTFDSTGQAIDALIWQTVAFSFTASQSFSTLSFLSLSHAGSAYGALIDNVQVTAVPEPSALLLMAVGVGGVARLGRHRMGRWTRC